MDTERKKAKKRRDKEPQQAENSGSEIDNILNGMSESLQELQHTESQDKESKKKSTKQILKSMRNLKKKLIAESQGSNAVVSWRNMAPQIIPPHCMQTEDQCWTVAVYRGYEVVMRKHGRPSLLTPSLIFNGVHARHRNRPGGAIDSFDSVIPFMSSYATMKVYYRPKLEDVAGNIAFEEFLQAELMKVPIAVSLDVLPSCPRSTGLELFVPTDEECRARIFEKFPRHCLLLTGHGVENGVRFWEGQDNFDIHRGVQGFVKFARDFGLIRAVIVFEVLPEEEE